MSVYEDGADRHEEYFEFDEGEYELERAPRRAMRTKQYSREHEPTFTPHPSMGTKHWKRDPFRLVGRNPSVGAHASQRGMSETGRAQHAAMASHREHALPHAHNPPLDTFGMVRAVGEKMKGYSLDVKIRPEKVTFVVTSSDKTRRMTLEPVNRTHVRVREIPGSILHYSRITPDLFAQVPAR